MERSVGDYFISDSDDDLVGEAYIAPTPVVVQPVMKPGSIQSGRHAVTEATTITAPEEPPGVAVAPEVSAATIPQAPGAGVEESSAGDAGSERSASSDASGGLTREDRLAGVLNDLIADDPGILAAALVSLDGFTMASALPEGMEPDRVGAMSAAILGLGERAATELGRDRLSQVIIEGDSGYVVLLAAGSYAVLTVIADSQAKLGLVLYDMRAAAARAAEALG